MKPSAFQWTRSVLLFTGLILIVFGVASILRIITNPGRAALYVFYAFAMFGDAAVMLFCAWQLQKRTRFAFLLSFLMLALNIVLTIFDQIGLVDILFALLNLIALILLIRARREFLAA